RSIRWCAPTSSSGPRRPAATASAMLSSARPPTASSPTRIGCWPSASVLLPERLRGDVVLVVVEVLPDLLDRGVFLDELADALDLLRVAGGAGQGLDERTARVGLIRLAQRIAREGAAHVDRVRVGEGIPPVELGLLLRRELGELQRRRSWRL